MLVFQRLLVSIASSLIHHSVLKTSTDIGRDYRYKWPSQMSIRPYRHDGYIYPCRISAGGC